MTDQISEGRAAKNAGMDAVLDTNREWAWAVRQFIKTLPAGWQGQGEDIRFAWLTAGGLPPRHHNCWGACINAAVRAGDLTKTGRMACTKSTRTHAHQTSVYTR